jgi:hypothetical protein
LLAVTNGNKKRQHLEVMFQSVLQRPRLLKMLYLACKAAAPLSPRSYSSTLRNLVALLRLGVFDFVSDYFNFFIRVNTSRALFMFSATCFGHVRRPSEVRRLSNENICSGEGVCFLWRAEQKFTAVQNKLFT